MEKKLEYFTIRPSLKQYYGIKVHKNTTFDETTEDGTVKQHFDNLTLTTEINRKVDSNEQNPFTVEETSKMTVKMPVGTILVWDENDGFILPQYQMTTLSELEGEIKEFKDVYKESKV